MGAALALPILAIPARAGAADVNEAGFTLLTYKERKLIKVTEPVLWARGKPNDDWELSGSLALDIVSGASSDTVSNLSGRPVQTITGASVTDRRRMGDVKALRHFGDLALGASLAFSREEDYFSRAYGLQGQYSLNQKNTVLTAGFGRSDDKVRSSDNPDLDEPRGTNEYLLGVTQVVSPTALLQSTLSLSRGHGFYDDPYRFTLTFYPTGAPAFMPDTRPRERHSVAWLTRWRQHVPAAGGTLQAEYRYFRDDWGIRAHTLEAAWQQSLGERWSVRPALRYYTQTAADFYSPLIPQGRAPEAFSSDQRLAAFGGLSPSLRVSYAMAGGYTLEATAGYVHNARNLRLAGAGSEAFATLRAAYGVFTIAKAF